MIDFTDFFEADSFKKAYTSELSTLQCGFKMRESIAGIHGLEEADIVLLGCHPIKNESGLHVSNSIREALYQLYDWHPNIKVLDIGTILPHAEDALTPKVLEAVLTELHDLGKVTILIGGTQDYTLHQYAPFRKKKTPIEITLIDQGIDLKEKEIIDEESYLMELLLSPENYIKHLNVVGFESYYTNPNMLETLDKLRFDCYRVGRVREDFASMEPIFRNSALISLDLNVLRASEGVFYKNPSPNGIYGDELCALAKYAGMSSKIKSFGIYGYLPEIDVYNIGAKLIAQIIWYFVDGYQFGQKDLPYESHPQTYTEYNVEVLTYPILFIKSKRTERWWMRLLNDHFIPCSNEDYLEAAQGNLPDAWLRAQERIT